jgi:eukaryotic-like serine/threonine-protein kinase
MPGLEGKTLDHYELRRVVGRGGMADVYAGYDPLYEREVAVKVFKREEEQMLRRFIREAQLMNSLDNTHLVPIYDSGSSLIGDITWYYIVMPFMQGGTLRARIRRSPLALTEACIDLGDIADALDYIHQRGIVHRDIKASNVLLDSEGRCYLADFGIARTNTDATQLTSTGNVLGTVDYVAPELFETNRKADAGTDLYSLGVLLFEMVTGQLPFTAENQIALVTMHMSAQPPAPSSIAPHIPAAVDRVILRALAKKPEQRYRSATELADAFCHAVAFGVADPAASEQAADAIFGVVPPADAYQGEQAPVASDLPTLIQSPAGQSARSGPVILPPPIAGQPRRVMQTPAFPLQGAPVPPLSPPRPSGPIRPPRRRDRRGLVVAIIALVALLLVLVPIIVVAIMHSGNTSAPGANGSTSTVALTQTATTGSTASPTAAATPTPSPTPNATATAQAQAAATATADAQATASAIAAVTATAQAQASATAGVIATATGGTPSYADALNNPNAAKTQAAQWDGLNGNDSQCVFTSAGYHVKQNVSSNNLHACHESAYQYGNAAIKVDVTILKGHSGGLFLRFNSGFVGNYNGYLFEVDSKGNYKFSIFAGSIIQNWTPSSALKTGYNVTNTLAVIMNGNSFAFYANGAYLTTLTDSGNQFTTGNVAFFASTANADTEVIFSNLGVYPSS